jgi:hypothetical protein
LERTVSLRVWASRSSLRRRTGLEAREAGLQTLQLGALVDHHPGERVDRRQRDAVGVAHRDVRLVLAQAERRAEVLRHRPDVADAGIVAVAPFADGQARHAFEDRVGIDRRCALFVIIAV